MRHVIHASRPNIFDHATITTILKELTELTETITATVKPVYNSHLWATIANIN